MEKYKSCRLWTCLCPRSSDNSHSYQFPIHIIKRINDLYHWWLPCVYRFQKMLVTMLVVMRIITFWIYHIGPQCEMGWEIIASWVKCTNIIYTLNWGWSCTRHSLYVYAEVRIKQWENIPHMCMWPMVLLYAIKFIIIKSLYHPNIVLGIPTSSGPYKIATLTETNTIAQTYWSPQSSHNHLSCGAIYQRNTVNWRAQWYINWV